MRVLNKSTWLATCPRQGGNMIHTPTLTTRVGRIIRTSTTEGTASKILVRIGCQGSSLKISQRSIPHPLIEKAPWKIWSRTWPQLPPNFSKALLNFNKRQGLAWRIWKIRLKKPRKPEKEKEILEVFRKVEINIPLLDAIKQVPRYARFLKDLCTNKRRLRGDGRERISCTPKEVSTQVWGSKYVHDPM